MKTKTISIEHLNKVDGLTTSFGRFLIEAVIHTLVISNHGHGVMLDFNKLSLKRSIRLNWEIELSEEVQTTWNDEQELVEFAATGLGILLVIQSTDFTFVKRAMRGSGGDYFIGKKTKNNLPVLEGILEISGILREKSNNLLSSRIKKKVIQVQKGNVNLPAYVIVIEFGQPKAKFLKV